MQIAIANADGQVSLWCEHNGIDDDGFLRFYVINGAWEGKFKDNVVYVNLTKNNMPGYLVWAGYANGDYNKVIPWIQEQIDNPEYIMLPLDSIYQYQPQTHHDEDDEVPF